MISAWTDHLKDPEEKERFKKHILGSKAVLDRLQVLMNRIDEDYRTTELNSKIYDLPNWDYRQADMNGGRRVLNTISKIINLDQQDTNANIHRATNARSTLLPSDGEQVL